MALGDNQLIEWLFITAAEDTSGQGNDGTLVGAPSKTDFISGPTRAYEIDNTILQKITVTGISTGNTGTVSMWYRTADVTANNICWGTDESEEYMQPRFSGDGKFYWRLSNANTGISPNPITNNNTWYHILFTWDNAGNALLYINNVLKSTVGSPSVSDTNMGFGNKYAGTTKYDHDIADVRVWSRVITSDERAEVFNAPNIVSTRMLMNISDNWKTVEGMQINIGDDWKEITGAKVNIGDSWKTIF